MQNSHKKKGVLAEFAFGLSLPFRSIRLLLTRPSLWIPCLIPWAIAGALTWHLIQQAVSWSNLGLAWLAGRLGLAASDWLIEAMQWVFTGAAWIAAALLLTWASALAALPFADWLAELCEKHVTPPIDPAAALAGWFSRAHWRRLKIDLFKSVAGMAAGLLGLVVSSIPLIGLLGSLLLALGITFQFVSYPQTRREVGTLAALVWLFRHLPACLGFGLIHLVGFSIPFFSAFLFPLAVIGGTLLFGHVEGHLEAKNKPPEP